MSQHGKDFEDLVEQLCGNSFLADFVVRSPMFRRAAGDEREAADLILPLGETLVAFQARSKRLSEAASKHGPDDVEVGRIGRQIKKAVEQVKTIRRALDRDGISVVENLRGIKLPFDCKRYTKIVGVVVIDLPSPDDFESEHDLDLYRDVDHVRGIPVHVFLRRDLEVLVDELDTIPDFLAYLEVREEVLRRGALMPVTRELDFLALYQTRYNAIEEVLGGKEAILVPEDGLWEATKAHHREEWEQRESRRRVSRIFDGVITKLHESIGYRIEQNADELGSALGQPGTIENYMRIGDELSRVPRVARMSLGAAMLEKATRADHDPKGFAYKLYMPMDGEAPILFLSSRQERHERIRILSTLCALAQVHLNADKIVGVATSNRSSPTLSVDYLLTEGVVSNEERRRLGPMTTDYFGPPLHGSPDQWGNDAAAGA